ncbi:MAG: energy transducer TonB [Bacteroidales bacterium]|nr:energy transducer TonB [Bacteroidales bacterium]
MKTKFFICAVAAFVATAISTEVSAFQMHELQEEVFNIIFVEEKPNIVIDGKTLDLNDYAMWIQEKAKTPEGGTAGRVICSLTITSTGKVTDVKIIRGTDEVTNAAAVALIESSPEWNPGKNNGKNVAVKATIPINFM